MVKFNNSWDDLLSEEFNKDYYLRLRETLKNEYKNYTVYPDMNDIFNAFKLTDYKDVRVVILGQDPYHEPGQAHGLAFSVKPGVRQPKSLINIFKEIQDDLGIEPPPPNMGCLEKWAKQGVLLLNTGLTVREHQAGSHKKIGWAIFTDKVIELLAEREDPIVFILWGDHARSKVPLIKEKNGGHLILEGRHPSPFSAYNGFFGGKYFSKCNDFLVSKGYQPIDWSI